MRVEPAGALASSPNAIDLLPAKTRPSRNNDLLRPHARHWDAANSAMRRLICRAPACAAIPLVSVPDDAAVGEALGTLAVLVAVISAPNRGGCRTPRRRPARPS